MKTKIYLLLVASVWCGVFSSCTDLGENRDIVLVESPHNFTATPNRVKVTLSWESPDDSRITQFKVDISRKEDFIPVDQTAEPDPSTTAVEFDDLESDVLYYARVRAITDDYLEFSDYTVITFTSGEKENVFTPLSQDDITPTSVTLKWQEPQEGSVTKIVVTPTGGSALPDIDLTTGDVSAREKLVEGLEPFTEYTAVIYDGDVERGKIVFTTEPESDQISVNGSNYNTLQEAIDAATSGDEILMKTGTYDYFDKTITINGKSVTIKAFDAASVPLIKLITFDLRGDMASVTFSGLTLQHAAPGGHILTDYQKHAFGGTWLTGTTGVTIENCDISGWEAGLFFTQTVGAGSLPEPAPGTATISLTVDNCLLHDFNAAGGDFIDFRSQSLAKVDYKNTSLWKAGRVFFRIDDTVLATVGHSITFRNSTFNSFCDRNFMRVRSTNENVVSVSVEQCIITNKIGNDANQVQGTGTGISFTNNNVFGSNAAAISSNLLSETGTTGDDPQYADADNGDFTVGNASVQTAAQGDPRWLP